MRRSSEALWFLALTRVQMMKHALAAQAIETLSKLVPADSPYYPLAAGTLAKCMDVLNSPEEYVEGLVFKSLNSKGFDDTSIVRCRKHR